MSSCDQGFGESTTRRDLLDTPPIFDFVATTSTAAATFRPHQDPVGPSTVGGCELRGASLLTTVALLHNYNTFERSRFQTGFFFFFKGKLQLHRGNRKEPAAAVF